MAAPNIVLVNDSNFDQQVVQSQTPVVVDFWAEWCGPCKMLAPVLDELADEYFGKVTVAKLNVDDSQAVAAKYGISAIPTLLFFKGGEVVDQTRGMRSKRDLKDAFDRLVG